MSQSDPRSVLSKAAASAEFRAQQDGGPRDSPEFSLVLGGPLYRLWRRTHLSGDALELLHRRVLVMTLLAWAPLLILSIAEGRAWGSDVRIPFLKDVELHARLLLALPLLIVGEVYEHRRMLRVKRLFLERGLIPDVVRPRFDAAIASAMRLRDSVLAELLLIALVLVIGIGVVWPRQVAVDVTYSLVSWYGTPLDGTLRPTLAGWWLRCVSLVLFQFLLLRWYFRLLIWARFLWHVSRIELQVEPMHPDRCAGLGFLGSASQGFAPLLLAQGTVLAGMMANQIFYSGSDLLDFKMDFLGLAGGLIALVLAPLLVFSPKLALAKREARREYGTLAMRYVREFNRKWLRCERPPDEPLMGSADIQSLADLGNSFQVPEGMRIVPFGLRTVLQLAITMLLPVLPLLLTMFSAEQILDKVLGMFF
jgi:hypothetical protein